MLRSLPRVLGAARAEIGRFVAAHHDDPPSLRRLRREAHLAQRNQSGIMPVAGFQVAYTDLMAAFMEYKDIFHRRIYHFEAAGPAPRILDGGGYVGMSVLYFKSVYPNARITCFEPDEQIFSLLEQNMQRNALRDVELVQAALSVGEGKAAFSPDGADGGRIVEGEDADATIRTVPLSRWLDAPVDFLKLNIEGQELGVLEEAGDQLRQVREIVLEYHGWPNAPQRLGPILELLDRQGFRYLVNHFDYETNGSVRSPFNLAAGTTWFCLVYAKRDDLL